MSVWDTRGSGGGNITLFPLKIRPARLPDPRAIPPRPWLYGSYLLRGFVSILVAPGGTGKSQFALAMLLSMAIGRPLLRHRIHRQCNVWYFWLEDPEDEFDRRLAAMMLRYDIRRDELEQSFYVHSGRERPLCVAKISDDGSEVIFPDKDAILAEAKICEVGVIAIDPYVRSHQISENANEQQAEAITAWNAIGEAIGAGVLLVHHTRKGPASDIDAARGAKAMTDQARVGLLMSAMSESDATSLGINPDERDRYLRIDNAKANMAPRATRAEWYHLAEMTLGNGTPDYPAGDTVTAIEAWDPPSPFEGLSIADCNAILDEIAAGLPDNIPFAPGRRGGGTRWCGSVLIARGMSEVTAGRIIDAWLKAGVLEQDTYHDPRQGREKPCVRVNDAKRPG